MTVVRRAVLAERDAIVATVVAAFATESVLRWVWPEDARFADRAHAFFGLLADLRLAGGEVWVTDDLAAVAMWNPPGGLYAEAPDGAWPALTDTFTDDERARWDVFDAGSEAAMPAQPFWYLGVLATRPEAQGRGLGSAVLAPMLAAADRASLPAVLETAGEANRRFYAKHGFGVRATLQLPDGAPVSWILERPAASATKP